MRLNSKWLAVLLVLAVAPLSGCGFMKKLDARDNLNKGVKAFTDQKYDAAAQYFEKTVELDPELETARMYLATAYSYQFVPGSTDPKSEEMANKAIETFKYLVEHTKDRGSETNVNAMLGVASLYYHLKKFPESKEWCRKVMEADSKNAEAYYRIAVIDFEDTIEKTGVQGEMVSLMTAEEKAAALKNVEEALTCISKAIEVRSNYFDAMEYQNLLWREKAKFETDEAKKAELLTKADKVSQQALAMKLKAEAEKAKNASKIGVFGATEKK